MRIEISLWLRFQIWLFKPLCRVCWLLGYTAALQAAKPDLPAKQMDFFR
jgi:hypothetical protein